MILIADSGSTKTDWVLLNKKKASLHYLTEGYNPYYYGTEKIEVIVGSQLLTQLEDPSQVKAIYFYGAGCSTAINNEKVASPLRRFFPQAHITIEHDLLGAAHALLGRTEGIACILGTGSNTCYFDGQKVVNQVPSLGYIYGDEGSGTYIGHRLIKDYLSGYLPADLEKIFEDENELNKAQVLADSYNNPNPNKFMALFPKFVKRHIDHPYLDEMVDTCFQDFYREQLGRYEKCHDLPVSFVGSIAYEFRPQLERLAERNNFKIGKIIQKPVYGLIDYYSDMK